MRRFLYLLTFVLIACLFQTAEARKLALLVGVDDYIGVKSLECCVNDMNALKEALIKIGFEEDDIQMLVTGGKLKNCPTKKNIEKAISQIVMKAQPSDMVFLAFSGHGAQDGKNVYFCPPDVEMEDLKGSCVSINKVMDILANKCKAKFKWMVVDACRNDPTGGPKGIGGKGLQVIPAPPAGIALFQSCAEGEESWEDRDTGNGYFTKNFAAALSGEADSDRDGKLTLFEVCKWTTAHTKEQVKNSQNKSQCPYFSGTVSDFMLTEDLNVPKAKALIDEARKAVDEKNYALAIKKYDEAIALCSRFESWKRERKMAQELLKQPSDSGGGLPLLPDISPIETSPIETSPTSPSITSGMSNAGERKEVTVNGVEFAFRWCPPGTFTMGSPASEEGRNDDEEKQREITLTTGFWMLETEVTQKQWRAVMGKLPDCGFKGDDLPVERVSWSDCKKFCEKCSQLGLAVQLPTEAQWEYACRAGTTGAYAGNLVDMAWYNESWGKGSTHPVGKKKPNAWGLYDMHGNVREWCSDYWDKGKNITNLTVILDDVGHVYRGGGWFNLAKDCRSASRSFSESDSRLYDLGFRVVRSMTNQESWQIRDNLKIEDSEDFTLPDLPLTDDEEQSDSWQSLPPP